MWWWLLLLFSCLMRFWCVFFCLKSKKKKLPQHLNNKLILYLFIRVPQRTQITCVCVQLSLVAALATKTCSPGLVSMRGAGLMMKNQKSCPCSRVLSGKCPVPMQISCYFYRRTHSMYQEARFKQIKIFYTEIIIV